MKKIFVPLIAICLFLQTFAIIPEISNTTPTERYLQSFPIEKIKASFQWDNYMTRKFDEQFPLLEKMIENEKRAGFFGYHGSSQKYRIFQDILRAVFEETLGYKIPKDFQFLRIPGDSEFTLKNNKTSFYEMFDRKELPKAANEYLIERFFITPFNDRYNKNITLHDLDKGEKEQMWKGVLDFLVTLDTLAREDYYSYKETDPAILPLKLSLTPEPPASDDLASVRQKLDAIRKRLDEKPIPQKLDFNALLTASKIADIFDRVLKIKKQPLDFPSMKQWLTNEIGFRSMLDRAYSLTYDSTLAGMDLSHFLFPYNDTYKEQQSRVVCMNLSLFGNFHRSDECSFIIFLNNSTIEGGDKKVAQDLKKFFDRVGLDKGLVDPLFDEAAKELNLKAKGGCILQFFDESETPYQGADETVYVSHSWGIPLKSVPPSKLAAGEHPYRNNHMDLQQRLIASNSTTLNPYSFLRIVRYDSLDAKTAQGLIDKMKQKLKKAKIDKTKRDKYKKMINDLWKI